MPNWTEAFLFVLTLVFALGFFITKTKGFGRFNTSALIIIMVMSYTAFFVADNALGKEIFSHLPFAALGFAGGLLRDDEPKSKEGADEQTNGKATSGP